MASNSSSPKKSTPKSADESSLAKPKSKSKSTKTVVQDIDALDKTSEFNTSGLRELNKILKQSSTKVNHDLKKKTTSKPWDEEKVDVKNETLETTIDKNRKHKNFREKIIVLNRKFTPMQRLLGVYALILLIGTLVLFIPFTQNSEWREYNGDHMTFVDTLFVVASAWTDTGIMSISFNQVYNSVGIFIISALVLIGGIGWYTIKVLIINFIFRKSMSYRSSLQLNSERAGTDVGNTSETIIVAVTVIFSCLAVFGLSLTLQYYYSEPEVAPWMKMQLGSSIDSPSYVIGEAQTTFPAIIWANADSANYYDASGNLTKDGIISTTNLESILSSNVVAQFEEIGINQVGQLEYVDINGVTKTIGDDVNYYTLKASVEYYSTLEENPIVFTEYQYIYWFSNPQHDWWLSIQNGIYTTNFTINNAGADYLGQFSYAYYYGNTFMQINMIMLIWIGGIGFSVFYDFYLYLKYRRTGRRFHFSLLSKISLTFYFAMWAFAFGTIGVSEWANNSSTDGQYYQYFNQTDLITYDELDITNQDDINWLWMEWNSNGFHSPFLSQTSELFYGTQTERTFAIAFNTSAAISAGPSTIQLNDFSQVSILIIILVMFIGGAPSSTSGGIRVTTFAILLIAMINFVRNSSETHVYKRKVSTQQVRESIYVFLFAILLVLISIVAICTVEQFNTQVDWSTQRYGELMNVMVVVTSCFGTDGFNMTSNLNEWTSFSKLVLVLVMFVGQLGVGNALQIFRFKERKDIIGYPEEAILIG